MPYQEYDPLTTLRGLQGASEIRDAGVTRRMRMLQFAQAQKQWDDQQKIDAAAKASVVPARGYAPSAAEPMNLPQQTVTNPEGVQATLPGANLSGASPSPVSNPAHFDSEAFTGRLRGIDPLTAQNYEQTEASIQQKQQDAQVERQQKLVQLQNGLADLDTKDRAAADAKRKQIKEVTGKAAQLAWVIKNAPPEQKAQVYQYVRNAAMQDPQLAQSVQGMPEQYTPEIEPQLDQIIASGLEVDKLIDNSRQAATQAETVRHNKAMETKRGLAATPYPGQKQNDAKDIAAAIISGEQPPTLTGLYRNAAPVRAELARQHFNLQQAESDWKAVQKHLTTLNGAQQERLRQSVSFAYDSLDQIDQLYGQWKKLAGPSGFKILNKANLAASAQLPGETGAVAQNLVALINDFTSEMGTVYKGGNSSTDETLRLASGNLKADWNDETFTRAVKQLRTTLGIRRNSFTHSQAMGVSADSPYSPGGGNSPANTPYPGKPAAAPAGDWASQFGGVTHK